LTPNLETLAALARFNPRVLHAIPEGAEGPPGHWVVAVEGILAEGLAYTLSDAVERLKAGLRFLSASTLRLWGTDEQLLALMEELRETPEGALLADALLDVFRGYHAMLSERSPTRVVGILNVTPDSFSDGGRFLGVEVAVARAKAMEAEGADWIDVGGESTRPGAAEVPVEEEMRRVLPVLEAVRGEVTATLSIDTRKAAVAQAALAAGATLVNDVSGLTFDPRMADVVAAAGAGLVLMHSLGTPATMQENPVYDDVVADTLHFLRQQVVVAVRAGISLDRIWIDPGFGFGKTLEHNLTILRRLPEYASAGLPLLLGTSRKSSLGTLLGGAPPDERGDATAATVALAIAGGARAVRVHDVRAMARVARVADAIVGRAAAS
jgi:dihydropteroate synthase